MSFGWHQRRERMLRDKVIQAEENTEDPVIIAPRA